MIELSKMTDFARKTWVQNKWNQYSGSRNSKAIQRSLKTYNDPTDTLFQDNVDRASWKDTIDEKVDYLLARPPLCPDHQGLMDSLLDFIKESAKQFLLRGSLIWVAQGDGESIDIRPGIINNAIAVYADEAKQKTIAYIRKYIDIEVDAQTGAEKEVEYYECYYLSAEGEQIVSYKDLWCYSNPQMDAPRQVLEEQPLFIQLGKTGDAPLFAYVEGMVHALDKVFRHQDTTVEKNTKPLVEIRGYTGTDEDDLSYAVDTLSIVKTDGSGGVTIHSRSMDSAAIDLWLKALKTKYHEATATVGKEDELQYATSGKAMDRLFVRMENSARELAHVLEQALKQYFAALGFEADIVWNTDRPVDDASIINSIVQSRGILSDRTLLEQHPWVDNVEEEEKRLATQKQAGFEDLVDDEF